MLKAAAANDWLDGDAVAFGVSLRDGESVRRDIDGSDERIRNLMDPRIPLMSGVVQNQDSYMKGKIAQRWYYDRVGPALALLIDISLVYQFLGDDYALRDVVRLTVFALIAAGAWLKLGALLYEHRQQRQAKDGVRARQPKPEGSRQRPPPPSKSPEMPIWSFPATWAAWRARAAASRAATTGT